MSELKADQYLRSYIVEKDRAKSAKAKPGAKSEQRKTSGGDAIGQAIAELLRPWGGYTLTIDCETTVGVEQNLRVHGE
jgi:hypothetical protein